jgi:hypothetical protein
MQWRKLIARTLTERDLAEELIRASEQAHGTAWEYDASARTLRRGRHVVNLADVYLEYSKAPRNERARMVRRFWRSNELIEGSDGPSDTERRNGPPLKSDRECTTHCARFSSKTRVLPTPSRRIAAKIEWFEWKAGLLASGVLRWPAIALIAIAVVIVSAPGSTTADKDRYESSGTLGGAPIAISVSKVVEPTGNGVWRAIRSRIVARWTVLVALGGLLSLLKVLESVVKNESRYLTLDLVIDAPKSGDTTIMITTVVENKLEDDKKIHNALLLVGSARRTPAELFQSLSDRHNQIQQRVWCGQQIDTWLMREKQIGEDSLISNGGATWISGEYPDPQIADLDCLLAACPLESCAFVSGSGADVALIQGLSFYFDENDDIANERVSFPVALEATLFEPGHPYIARFYVIGEQEYPVPETLSRCTAKAFVIPLGDTKK